MPLQESNSLILEHYGKYFGQNNRWDTQSENNVIVQDRGVRLVHLELDEVDIVKYVFGNWPYVTDQGESFPTNYFGHNGKCTVNFDAPVYPWIIANLVRTTASTAQKPQDFVIETSHNDLFNYSQDIDIIEEIENILEEHAHLFDKSSQV